MLFKFFNYTSKGTIAANLVLKQTCESTARNILLFAVTFVLMILLTFTGTFLFNVNVHPENFLTTISEEIPDIMVQAKLGKIDELISTLEKMSRQ
ncbi:MAG: hypothetical protein K2H01_01705 [Ruminococcus sp.]|nr:hypothetical protein [Ruminococcus sp.]